jgi:hypothetical protein
MRLKTWTAEFVQKHGYLLLIQLFLLLIIINFALKSQNESVRMIPPNLVFKKNFKVCVLFFVL